LSRARLANDYKTCLVQNSYRKQTRHVPRTTLDQLTSLGVQTNKYRKSSMLDNNDRKSRGSARGHSRQMLNGNVLGANSSRRGYSFDIGNGLKQCAECTATFSSSDVHSCVNYLQKLMRTVVGDTAFKRAQVNLDSSLRQDSKEIAVELGTIEELLQD